MFTLLQCSNSQAILKLLISHLTENGCVQELKQLADDVRSELSFLRYKTLKPITGSLAVVELTIAIHDVFHAPMDKILWDAGEQVRSYFIFSCRRECLVHLDFIVPTFFFGWVGVGGVHG